jgi:hypothetical protein
MLAHCSPRYIFLLSHVCPEHSQDITQNNYPVVFCKYPYCNRAHPPICLCYRTLRYRYLSHQAGSKEEALFVQGDFTPHQYTTENGKQGLSLEVNVEKFSFADGSKPQEYCQQL